MEIANDGRIVNTDILQESDVPNLSWNKITNIPNTLSGYGILDGALINHNHLLDNLRNVQIENKNVGDMLVWNGMKWCNKSKHISICNHTISFDINKTMVYELRVKCCKNDEIQYIKLCVVNNVVHELTNVGNHIVLITFDDSLGNLSLSSNNDENILYDYVMDVI